MPKPYTEEELYVEDRLPRNRVAEIEDAKFVTRICHVETIFIALPPPDAHSARPVRAILANCWGGEQFRELSPPGTDHFRVPKAYERAQYCLVPLDNVQRPRKLGVLYASGEMSKSEADELQVTRGELLLASVHAHSAGT